MARSLKFNLLSQSQIPKEGKLDVDASKALAVGGRKIDFYVPLLEDMEEGITTARENAKVQEVVDKINQYIENIADDFLLLGLHLIALHRALKNSGLTIDQIKSWYAENINMPYSSAMQCKKVAEVYGANPDLINRYTASGAYLLSSLKTPEEREAVWAEAKGDKPSATVRDIREALKKKRDRLTVVETENDDDEEELEDLPVAYRMNEAQIHEAYIRLTGYAEDLVQCADPEEQIEMRQALVKATQDLLEKISETL
ncbi:MAG: hypothetical protein HQM12_14825 [SAR324 cluster bacterium]|nr:hypothetical protein [SAR324 cluster bacterium]